MSSWIANMQGQEKLDVMMAIRRNFPQQDAAAKAAAGTVTPKGKGKSDLQAQTLLGRIGAQLATITAGHHWPAVLVADAKEWWGAHLDTAAVKCAAVMHGFADMVAKENSKAPLVQRLVDERKRMVLLEDILTWFHGKEVGGGSGLAGPAAASAASLVSSSSSAAAVSTASPAGMGAGSMLGVSSTLGTGASSSSSSGASAAGNAGTQGLQQAPPGFALPPGTDPMAWMAQLFAKVFV